MRTFAVIYPQLMNQAIARGLSESDLTKLHRGHWLAQRLVDGIYRKDAAPFLCHLVRTASIVMTETREIDVILAALLHSTGFLHYFKASRRRGPRTTDLEMLRQDFGVNVAELIMEYASFRWNRDDAVRSVAGLSERKRQLLLMKLANELEDHLDAAFAYVAISPEERRSRRYGLRCIELANDLGHTSLAQELSEAFASCERAVVPPTLIENERGSYELRGRLFQANVIERIGSAIRRYREGRNSVD